MDLITLLLAKSYADEKAITGINAYGYTQLNLFNKNFIKPGYYINGSGIETPFGSNVGGISHYIPVEGGKQYTFNNESAINGAGNRFAGAWYDKGKKWISTIEYSSPYPVVATVTAPANAAYLRINYTTSRLNDIVCVPGSILPPKVPSRFFGKKANFLGDSITNGVGASADDKKYVNLVKSLLGLSVARNYGINATLIAHEDGKTNAFVDRYTSMDDDADLVVVYGGINDYYNGTGQIGQEDSVDTTTFYGALNVLMNGLRTKYAGKEIVFITPFQSYFSGKISDEPNENSGANLKGYRDVIKNRAEHYGIPVLDLFSMGGIDAAHNADSRTAFTTDGVHPNDAGHAQIANRLAGLLSTL